MAITTELWGPISCTCWLNHRFEETDIDKVPIYCSQAEAELIRLEKHERLLTQHGADNDVVALQGRLRWWGRQGPLDTITCPAHTGLAGESLYATLVDETARQNITLNIVLVQDLGLDHEDVRFTWTGQDADRLLTLQFPNTPVSVDARGGLQSAADLQFGAGKVLVG